MDTVTECAEKELVVTVVYMRYEIGGRGTEWLL